jgi:hypothetical protein
LCQIREAEFEDFEEPLVASLAAFRAQEKASKKPSAKRQKLDSADGAGAAGADAEPEEAAPMDTNSGEKSIDGGDAA